MSSVQRKAISAGMHLDLKMNSSCDYHRVVLPYTAKEFHPKVPVLVYNRVYSYGINTVRKLKADGVKIVLDLDDYFELDSSHYLFKHFEQHTKDIREGLKLADVITVTTEFLASKIRHLNSNVVVIRNALPFDEGQFTLNTDNTGTLVVWAGGESHFNDLMLMKGGLPEEYTSFAGYNPKSEQWAKIYNNFKGVNMIPQISAVNYMSVYDGHGIALAPLVDSFFNNCKSNLKILEAGAKGLPIICSKVLPYFNEVDKDVVIYAENKSEWYGSIMKLIHNYNLREDMGLKLAEHVRLHYNLEDANELRRQVIESFS